jgi:hypothetical protein
VFYQACRSDGRFLTGYEIGERLGGNVTLSVASKVGSDDVDVFWEGLKGGFPISCVTACAMQKDQGEARIGAFVKGYAAPGAL